MAKSLNEMIANELGERDVVTEISKINRRLRFDAKRNAMRDGLRERADRYDHKPTRGSQRNAAIAANIAEWED